MITNQKLCLRHCPGEHGLWNARGSTFVYALTACEALYMLLTHQVDKYLVKRLSHVPGMRNINP